MQKFIVLFNSSPKEETVLKLRNKFVSLGWGVEHQLFSMDLAKGFVFVNLQDDPLPFPDLSEFDVSTRMQ